MAAQIAFPSARGRSMPQKLVHVNPSVVREIFFVDEVEMVTGGLRNRIWVHKLAAPSSSDKSEWELPQVPVAKDAKGASTSSTITSTSSTSYQQLMSRHDFGFEIEGIVPNDSGSLLCLYGQGGIAILQLSRRVRDEIDQGIDRIMCPVTPIDDDYFLSHHALSILRVVWQRSCLWVLTTASLRVYDVTKHSELQVEYPIRDNFIDFAILDNNRFYLATSEGSVLLESNGRKTEIAYQFRQGTTSAAQDQRDDTVGLDLAAKRGCCSLLLIPPLEANDLSLRFLVLGHRSGMFEVLVSFNGGQTFEVLERLNLSLPPEASYLRTPYPLLYWDNITNNRIFVQHAFGLSALKLPWLKNGQAESSIELLLNERPLAGDRINPLLGFTRCSPDSVCAMTSDFRLHIFSTSEFSFPPPSSASLTRSITEDDGISHRFQNFLQSLSATRPKLPAKVRRRELFDPKSIEHYEHLVSMQPELNQLSEFLQKVMTAVSQQADLLVQVHLDTERQHEETAEKLQHLESEWSSKVEPRVQSLVANQTRLEARCLKLMQTLNQMNRSLSAAERQYFNELRDIDYTLKETDRQVTRMQECSARLPQQQSQQQTVFPEPHLKKIQGLLEKEGELIKDLSRRRDGIEVQFKDLEQKV